MDSFRVIIAGCRDFNNYELLRVKCDHMLSKKKDTHKVIIVSGHAAGADALGEVYALERGFDLETYPADWSRGRMAGPLRNERMARVADALIAFWDGMSTRTKQLIDMAIAKQIPVKIIRY